MRPYGSLDASSGSVKCKDGGMKDEGGRMNYRAAASTQPFDALQSTRPKGEIMTENKTKATGASVTSYLANIEDAVRRKDCEALVKLMTKATNQKSKMWGSNIIGFGSYHYKYESGREGDACVTGFSSRKSDISIYLTAGFDGR